MRKIIKHISILIFIIVFTIPYIAAEEFITNNPDTDFAQVEYVKLEKSSAGAWKITVTVRHNDQGWGHYADYWKVTESGTGKLLGERILHHPHDNEQPFTRSASGIKIDKNSRFIEVSAKCNKHGFEGRRIIIDLEKKLGEFFSIKQ